MEVTFKQLGVSARLILGLEELGFRVPTPIQQQVIPYLMQNEGKDVVAQAQTGTGKTAAFGLPLLMKVDSSRPEIQGLVLAPTRELAKQIQKHLFRFTKHSAQVFSTVLCGGEPIGPQVVSLRRPTQIIVATPGRLLDLIERKALSLERVKYLILDEADEMLSMGFRGEIEKIIALCEGRRSTWLFSATFPKALNELIQNCMAEKPHRIQIDQAHVVNQDILHQVAYCRREEKDEFLAHFLNERPEDRGLVFARTKAGVITLTEKLAELGVAVDSLHGDLTQPERDKVMRAFKNEKLRVLVATDVAARGIDVKDLAFVVQYQLPDQIDAYTHRSGRTARAGKKGLSLVMIALRERQKLAKFEDELGISFQEWKGKGQGTVKRPVGKSSKTTPIQKSSDKKPARKRLASGGGKAKKSSISPRKEGAPRSESPRTGKAKPVTGRKKPTKRRKF